jgi:hypothetical protein
MTWVLILWVAATVLFIVLINTAANNDVREECVGDEFECDTAISIASGVWTAIGFVVGFMGFVVLGIIWLMTRPRRHCPACGADAKKGITQCRKCGYLFTAVSVRPAMPLAPSPQWAPPPPPSGPLPPPSGQKHG